VDRREFLTAAAVATVSPLPHRNTFGQSASRQYFELRRYHLLPGTKQRAFSTFVGDVAIPAMNRAGAGRVRAFTVVYGENEPSLLLVLTHQTLDSVVSLRERLAADTTYTRAGAAILEAPLADPAFAQITVSPKKMGVRPALRKIGTSPALNIFSLLSAARSL